MELATDQVPESAADWSLHHKSKSTQSTNGGSVALSTFHNLKQSRRQVHGNVA